MKRAETINELANNLIPSRMLKREDHAQYVPIFENILKQIRGQILYEDFDSQTFYIAGQSGTGKSTALTFLPTPDLQQKYEVLYINGKELFDLNDLDIIDVLMMVGSLLIKDNKDLTKKFEDELKRIVDNIKGTLEEVQEVSKSRGMEAGAEAEVGLGAKFLAFFSAKTSFFGRLKMDRNVRNITRKVFRSDMVSLFELINQIMARYLDTLSGKKLLIIFNDLDHLKEVEQIQELFIENRSYLEGLACKKIISIPVHLTVGGGFNENTEFFGLKLNKNPLGTEDTKKTKQARQNRTLLKQVLELRMAEGSKLIDEKAIDEAIKYSGGVIRQFMNILYRAAIHVRTSEGKRITLEDISIGCEDASQALQRQVISGDRIALLDDVMRNNSPTNHDSELFIEALLGNQVLMYNNRPNWYEVNPLITYTVQVYAAKIKEEAGKNS